MLLYLSITVSLRFVFTNMNIGYVMSARVEFLVTNLNDSIRIMTKFYRSSLHHDLVALNLDPSH